MKHFYAWLTLMGLGLCCVGFGFQQAPPPAKVAKAKYAKGHVTAKDIGARHAAAFRRHGHRMKSLPKATPASYDCRTIGIVPPIVDQGQCGSCWDFSGTGMCTSACIKAGYGKADGSFMLSEQYTLDCGQNGGCNGDDNTTVLTWAKATGLPTTAAYGPYQGSSGQCKYTTSMQLYQIADWGFCTPSQQEGIAAVQDIKNAMVTYGPIGSGVAADDAFSNYQAGTVFTGSGSTDIDHDIILVGWQDDTTIQAGGYWILRNSWGTSWGEQGYMRIAYGANAVGTEAVWCTATALPPPPPPPGPTPPGPTPPPGPVVTTTLTINNPLPAGTYEISTSGTAAGITKVVGDVQALQALNGTQPAPKGSPCDQTAKKLAELEGRLNELLKSPAKK